MINGFEITIHFRTLIKIAETFVTSVTWDTFLLQIKPNWDNKKIKKKTQKTQKNNNRNKKIKKKYIVDTC
jgi:hypothetical protein